MQYADIFPDLCSLCNATKFSIETFVDCSAFSYKRLRLWRWDCESMKYIKRILTVCIIVILFEVGIFIIHSVPVRKSSLQKVSPTSKTLVQNYRMSKGVTKKVAVAVQPLRSDGVHGKPTKKFLAVKNLYNLMFSPTYDGSGQATHPKLLYFPNGWNGYRYWMSYTPYPAMNASLENPCIVTSNDLKTWVVPKGLHNPVSGVPADVRQGGHYSDSELVMRGNTMELWYRYNHGNKKTKRPVYSMDYYYRRVSTDGIHWSSAQLMRASKTSILSLAAIYRNGEYQFWYTDCYHRLIYAVSRDGYTWIHPQKCEIQLPAGYAPWHQDVIYYQDKYYLLQTGIYKPKYSFALFLSESYDGIHFTDGTPFYPSNNSVILHKAWLYRSTMVPISRTTFDMVVSYMLPGNKWFMTQFTLPVAEWDNACFTNQELVLKAPHLRKTVKLNHVISNSRKYQSPVSQPQYSFHQNLRSAP